MTAPPRTRTVRGSCARAPVRRCWLPQGNYAPAVHVRPRCGSSPHRHCARASTLLRAHVRARARTCHVHATRTYSWLDALLFVGFTSCPPWPQQCCVRGLGDGRRKGEGARQGRGQIRRVKFHPCLGPPVVSFRPTPPCQLRPLPASTHHHHYPANDTYSPIFPIRLHGLVSPHLSPRETKHTGTPAQRMLYMYVCMCVCIYI